MSGERAGAQTALNTGSTWWSVLPFENSSFSAHCLTGSLFPNQIASPAWKEYLKNNNKTLASTWNIISFSRVLDFFFFAGNTRKKGIIDQSKAGTASTPLFLHNSYSESCHSHCGSWCRSLCWLSSRRQTHPCTCWDRIGAAQGDFLLLWVCIQASHGVITPLQETS